MKNLLTAFILYIALVGVSFAQGTSRSQGVKTAVVEFTPGAGAAAMNDQAKRGLQSTLSASLNHTRKFDVYDTRHTRTASQANLAAINGTSTAAAVKLGKQLGVAYVVTGTVVNYTPKDSGGHGYAEVNVRLIEVATGMVRHSNNVSVRSGKPMYTGSQPEMHAKVLRHVIDQLTEILSGKV